MTESSKLKLEEKGCPLTGSLSNYSFRIGQKVWCYWKTADEKEKSYFEGEVIEMRDNATIVEGNLPISNEEYGIAEGERYFHTQAKWKRADSALLNTKSKLTISYTLSVVLKLEYFHLSDVLSDKKDVKRSPKKWPKLLRKPSKRRLVKQANDKDEEVI